MLLIGLISAGATADRRASTLFMTKTHSLRPVLALGGGRSAVLVRRARHIFLGRYAAHCSVWQLRLRQDHPGSRLDIAVRTRPPRPRLTGVGQPGRSQITYGERKRNP